MLIAMYFASYRLILIYNEDETAPSRPFYIIIIIIIIIIIMDLLNFDTVHVLA